MKFVMRHAPIIMQDCLASVCLVMILMAQKYHVLPTFAFVLVVNVVYIVRYRQTSVKEGAHV